MKPEDLKPIIVRRSWKDSFMGTLCPYCSRKITEENYSIDHIIPQSTYHIYQPEHFNKVVCCQKCNSKKGNQSLLFFMELINRDIKFKKRPKNILTNNQTAKLSLISGKKVIYQDLSIKKRVVRQFIFREEDGSALKGVNTYEKALKYAKSIAQVH